MEREFIPVLAVKDGIQTIYYLDVSDYGIEKLIDLRNELSGTMEDSIRKLDKIIYSRVTINRSLYDTNDSRYRKELKKENKKIMQKKKFGGKKKW